MKSRTFLALISFLLGATLVANAQKAPKVTGIFTNMHAVAKSQQVTGWEFTVVRSTTENDRTFCLVQQADGDVHPPVLVQVRVRGTAIEFTIPAGTDNRTFRGRVSAKELTGKFDGQSEILHLKRGKSFWQ